MAGKEKMKAKEEKGMKGDKKKDEKKFDRKPEGLFREIKDTGKYAKDIRFVVRIANKDLDGRLPIERALTGLKGIGIRMGRIISLMFEEKTGIAFDKRLGEIPEDKDKELEEIVLHPQNFGVPEWNLNRRKDFETGETSHMIMGDLDFALRRDFQTMGKIKSYKGLRHSWGLTVRGQRTRSSFRGKGGVVGVAKKEVAAKSAPAKADSGAKESKPPAGKKK
ncbi:MAG: 30S ribosomal protein S13 [archaeon]|nr:30S ribosomal protein S13 [archaeon]